MCAPQKIHNPYQMTNAGIVHLPMWQKPGTAIRRIVIKRP